MRHLRILLKTSVANNYNNMQCVHAVRQFSAKLPFQLHNLVESASYHYKLRLKLQETVQVTYKRHRNSIYITSKDQMNTKQFGPIQIFKCPSIGVILQFKLSDFSVKKTPYDALEDQIKTSQ